MANLSAAMNVVAFLVVTIQRHIVRIVSVVALIALVDISQSVPPNYCFLPLNTADCNGPPTPVFYYYHPGSRCEIGIWRGCPTGNKFPDEVLCSDTCIARFIARADSHENQVMEIKTDWENQLNQITSDEADDLIIILDEILEESPPPNRKPTKLKHNIATVETAGSELISEMDSSAIEDMPTTETASEITALAETTPTDSTTEDIIMTDSAIEDATTTDFTKEDTTITDSTTEDTATTTSTTTPLTTTATATTVSPGDADEVILIH